MELLGTRVADEQTPAQTVLVCEMGEQQVLSVGIPQEAAGSNELILWMEQILGDKLPATDLHEALRSGIVLRELQEKLFPDTARRFSPISRNYSSRMAPWKERENIPVFLKQCKALGMNDLSLFCTGDLYDGNNMVQVEMALSKVEKTGVDAGMLKDLVAGSGSPPKKAGHLDDSDAETASETEKDSSADLQVENNENTLEELEHELRGLDGSESCNQRTTPHQHHMRLKKKNLSQELDGNDDESSSVDELKQILIEMRSWMCSNGFQTQSKREDETHLQELLEEARHERLPETQVSEICETELAIDVSSVHRLESEAKTELMDAGKSETRVLDSTIALYSSQNHEISEDTEVKATNVSKKDKEKAKAAKKKKVTCTNVSKFGVNLFAATHDERVARDLNARGLILFEREHERLEFFKVKAALEHIDHVQWDLIYIIEHSISVFTLRGDKGMEAANFKPNVKMALALANVNDSSMRTTISEAEIALQGHKLGVNQNILQGADHLIKLVLLHTAKRVVGYHVVLSSYGIDLLLSTCLSIVASVGAEDLFFLELQRICDLWLIRCCSVIQESFVNLKHKQT
ncbi:Ras gtpase-activating protein rng2, partial [Globisporangium splendens]